MKVKLIPLQLGLIFWLLTSFWLSTATAELISAKDKRSSACATCHVDWLPDYKLKNVKFLIPQREYVVEKSGRQLITSSVRMCFSCHDGYINDSRFQFINGAHEHPVGVKPSAKIRVLKSEEGVVYPLNVDGKLYCGTCHTPHGNDWKSIESALFMRTKNINSSLCIDCHGEEASRLNNNHPTVPYRQKVPARLVKARSKLGKGRKVICQSCHRSHLVHSKSLLVIDNDRSELCVICHDEKKQIVDSKHDLTKHKRRLKNAKGQVIRENGTCSGCHVSHGGKGSPLLATIKRSNQDDVWAQCLVCHNEKGIAGKTSIGNFSHPVDVSISKVNIDVKGKKWNMRGSNRKLKPLPLYNKRGKMTRGNGLVQCPTCHDTHGSGGTSKDFLRVKQGRDSSLCANCHIRNSRIVDSKHNIYLYDDKKRRKIKFKGKIGDGICYACHTAHKGKAPNMLTILNENVDDSVSLMGNLCAICHTKNGAASESDIGEHSHPISMKLSKGMTSNKLPLFTFAGKRIEGRRSNTKGRVDCATCHDVHQWDPDNPDSKEAKNLKAKAHSGNSFLRASADGDSKLCTSCHEIESQVIGTDHDYRISAVWMDDAKKQKTHQAGVCAQCHQGHNNKTKVGLWAREPGKANRGGRGKKGNKKLDVQSSFCRSCHVKDHDLTRKDVPNGKHPDNVLVWKIPKRKIPGVRKGLAIPVFSPDGKKADVGIISCPSCHDPHQWKGSHTGKGPGKATEGSSMTSFLRMSSTGEIVCADCHGLDALFRYQYFHSKTNTKDHPLFIEKKNTMK